RRTKPQAVRWIPPATGAPKQRAETLFVPCPSTSSLLYQRQGRKNSLEKQKASVPCRCFLFFTDRGGSACGGKEWSPERDPTRRSRRPSVPNPIRNRNGAPCRTGGDPNTTHTLPGEAGVRQTSAEGAPDRRSADFRR